MISSIISARSEIMSTTRTKLLFAKDIPNATSRFGDSDRRKADNDYPEESITRQIVFDAKGNPVLSVQTNVPRRREDDHTIDLLECLDADKLRLEIDED